MQFEFLPIAALPRLAWCAEWTARTELVSVRHGPWVETRGDWFAEGAWDGDFLTGGFLDATTLAGSGGRLRAGEVVFASSTNRLGRLYAVRAGERLVVSNSLVFALVRAGDRPDPDYRRYYHDLVLHHRAGITGRPKTLPTAGGRELLLCDFCQLAVQPDLSLRLEPWAPGPVPGSFADHQRTLEATLAAVVANAADPARQQRYAPLAELSGGYDSTAVAVLAARAGCRRSVSILDERVQPGRDSGADTARRLGFRHRDVPRFAFRELPGVPELEFATGPLAQQVVIAPLAGALEGALLLGGRGGDDVWKLERGALAPALQRPSAVSIPGGSVTEFRLRVGYLRLPVPAIGIQHREALQRIMRSPELAPWSVGGGYDRPIPRRIAEEGGIPRGSFARAGKRPFPSLHLRSAADLSAAGRRDNARFRAALARRTRAAARVRHRLGCAAGFLDRALELTLSRVARATGLPLRLPRLVGEHYAPAYQDRLRLFHWGFEGLRDRYEAEGGASTQCVPR